MDDAEGRFRAVFESTYPVLVRYVRHRGLSGMDVEDLVAATYEVAWRRLDVVPAGDGALPWLLAVARNLLRNRWRKQLRERAVLERLGPPQHDESELPGVSWQDIRRALDRLPDRDRELILLVAWDGLAPTQAAIVLGLSQGTARTRLHRARARLAQVLGIEQEPQRSAASGHNTGERTAKKVLRDE